MGGEREVISFIILLNLILFTFIIGMIYFISQFRKRKILHDKEVGHILSEHEKAKLEIEIHAQKDTMQEIGKEIHDSVGQKLTLASIYLKKQSNSAIFKDLNLQEVDSLIDESLTELRQLSRTLVSQQNHHAKLKHILMLETRRVSIMDGINIRFNSNKEVELSEDIKHNIHRVIQEFLQNCVKHAECTDVTIGLDYGKYQLEVNCTDNGKGFNADHLDSKGVGLENIKKRITTINGQFTLYSEKGKGTNLNFVVPYS